MKTHLKVAHKLDMLGIGAAHTRDPNGIAWKQNRDFERLLAKLNGTEEGEGEGIKVDGFAKAFEDNGEESVEAEERIGEVDEEAERRARKERKREKRRAKEVMAEEGKKKKKRKTEDIEESEGQAVVEDTIVETVQVVTPAANTSRVPPRG
jgi:Pin2-interacting protein X1